jgi:hypothetical protein
MGLKVSAATAGEELLSGAALARQERHALDGFDDLDD